MYVKIQKIWKIWKSEKALDFRKKFENLENLEWTLKKIETLAKLGTCSMKIHMEFWAHALNFI